MKRRSVVIHGHFYQPPREDPWTDRVPRQASAAPAHDWNERIHDECYRPVTAAPVLDAEGRVTCVLNTLEWISWDAGATLLRWLAREKPDTYARFLEADARSLARTGHGNAVAAPYHHVILPLASRREKVTEVRWGIIDFERRFGRRPDGMWLPEAAIDMETLEVLASEEIAFTIVGPTQVVKPPKGGRPGRVTLRNGRRIALYVYDGGLAHDIAFGSLLKESERWIDRLVNDPEDRTLVSLATDGETFGHHHEFADLGLAATLSAASRNPALRVENYASFLERHPPFEEIQLIEPSAWSCAHGVERWRSDCGCKIDPSRASSQAWRSVLRDALGELAGALHARFEVEGSDLFHDPWVARDVYGTVVDGSDVARTQFLERHVDPPADRERVSRAEELLEMERDVLRMDTSCAWFFDDIARLEPLQNLLYAAHALDLLGDGAEALEAMLVKRLAEAKSNDPEEVDGARFWRTRVRGRRRLAGEAEDASELDDAEEDHSATPDEGPGPGWVDVGGPPAPPPGGPSATLRAVRRALAEPLHDAVVAASAALDSATDREREVARVAVAREVALRGGAVGELADLAERIGVAPVSTAGPPAGEPLRFVFGLHLHQPVGNFDEVFRSHVEEVYMPFLERCASRGLTPLALHVSGPLLEWLERESHPLLGTIGLMVDAGALELLLAGFYEPVLPVLTREDRIEQIGWMREWLHAHFGADATGLWLTERVWEPGLARDLVDAGVDHVFLDDRHFVVSGIERHRLHQPWRTEAEGRSLSVLPIDERLRYLVPFRSPGEIGSYLRGLSSVGHRVAVLADDGEKFGGWPGTAEWVWERGWLDAFLDEMERLAEDGVVRLATPSSVLKEVPPAGLTYLSAGSYREMEGWSLPPLAAERFERIGEAVEGMPGAAEVVRGGQWRNFLTRYDESNRMHKKAQRLSALCRMMGDPPKARRAIGRAQCNDAYWHGVFGGLYLRHLRREIWAQLAEAESVLRAEQGLRAESLDVDGDGSADVLVHSAAFSAVIRPGVGGRLVELTDFASRRNLADVLTRRREGYHRLESESDDHLGARHLEGETDAAAVDGGIGADGAMPSIHELEEGLGMRTLPPVDLDVRALGVDRVLYPEQDPDAYTRGDYAPLHGWGHERFAATVTEGTATVQIVMRSHGPRGLDKTFTFWSDGTVELTYEWDAADFPPDAWFAPEISVAWDPDLRFDPPPVDVWQYEVRTVSKRESGFEETGQGLSLTPLWRCRTGRARIVIPSPRPTSATA